MWIKRAIIYYKDNGLLYIGSVNNEHQPSDTGSIVSKHKNITTGMWKEGKLLGKYVEIQYADSNANNKYQGEYARGKPNGMGTLTSRDGSIYTVYFVDGMRHGKGSYTDKKGNKVSGTWENGKITTAKIVTQYADGKVYEGEHDETGNPHGQGVLKDSDGVRSYQGTFDHGALSGHGSYTDENGNTTSGIYENDSVVAKLLDITIFSEVLLMPEAA